MTLMGHAMSAGILRLLGWSLLHFVWQGGVLAFGLWLLLAASRKVPAQIRYVLCCGALALMALCPVLTFAYLLATLGDVPKDSAIVVRAYHGLTLHAKAWTLSTSSLPERIADLADRAMPGILATWIVGVFVLLTRAIVGSVALHRLKTQAIDPVSEGLHAVVQRASMRLGVRRAFAFFASRVVSGPMVIGWLKPVVLFPAASLAGLSAEQFEAILLHELAHIRRRDDLVNTIQVAMETLLFYHPAVWWVSRQIRQEREHCCDDIVVAETGSALHYAKALYFLEEQRSTAPQFALSGNGGQLSMRIKRLLTGTQTAGSSGATGWVLTAAVVLLIGGIAASTATFGKAWAQNPGATAVQKTITDAHEIPWEDAVKHLQSRVPPSYPEMAKAAHVSGEVRIALVIGPKGNVEAARVVSGPTMLQQAALDSVIHYNFSPFSEGDVATTVKIIFTLSDGVGGNELSCTYYDNQNVGHPGTCEFHKDAEQKYLCRADDGDRPSQFQVGCKEKLEVQEKLEGSKIEKDQP
ncbi:MAG TPA: M56 family metallopeptidase [Terracidiphilus sp.]|jgi:TonB family protein|nr:M56 family metallopeptidase [Terracidiphilus sp.]